MADANDNRRFPGPPDPQSLKDQWHFNLTNHKPHESTLKRIEGLRSAGKAMADAIIDMTPASREQSLALTHLEQMTMYAVAAIARNETEDNPNFVAPEQEASDAEK